MEKIQVYIMNFTHAYEQEPFMNDQGFQWINCTEISETECYCSVKAEKSIRQKIAPYTPRGIHFIDSGDYHYISKLWTDKIEYPYSLIIFDHHTDMQPALCENLLSCGCWVKSILDSNPFCQEVYLIGVADDLIKGVKATQYKNRLFFLSETDLKRKATKKQLAHMQIDTPIYISIDKDVLSPQFAVTNWDQGSLSLKELKELLQIILNKQRIIGIDICGECPQAISTLVQTDAEYVNNLSNKYLLQTFLELPKKQMKLKKQSKRICNIFPKSKYAILRKMK